MVNASSSRPRAVSVSYLTTTLPTAIPPIFDQVQQTTANHRKNVVALKKIQDSCVQVTEQVVKGEYRRRYDSSLAQRPRKDKDRQTLVSVELSRPAPGIVGLRLHCFADSRGYKELMFAAPGGRAGTKLVGEKAFNSLFIDMINRVLPIKKGVSVADRVVKFVASYVTYVTEQGGYLAEV